MFTLQVNKRDLHGTSALKAATRKGKVGCVRLLLQTRRCEINALSKRGRTVLHEAAKQGHAIIVMLLLTFGAEPNSCDEWGLTPLMYAALNGHIDTVTQLVRGGCDVNIMSRANHTALHTAAQKGHEEIVKILLDYGANADVQDDKLNTPLLLAGAHRFPRIMCLLLEAGCDVRRCNASNRAALHFAALHDYQDIARRLVLLGAPPDDTDNLGCTPLTLAIGRNLTLMIHMFMSLNCRLNLNVLVAGTIQPVFLIALKHADLHLLKLLVAGGCDYTCVRGALVSHSLPDPVTSNEPLLSWLRDISADIPTLRHLATNKVRRCLGRQMGQSARKLPLPQSLIDALSLKGLLPPSDFNENTPKRLPQI